MLLASCPWGGSGSSTRGRRDGWDKVVVGSETTAPCSETAAAAAGCVSVTLAAGDYNVFFSRWRLQEGFAGLNILVFGAKSCSCAPLLPPR